MYRDISGPFWGPNWLCCQKSHPKKRGVGECNTAPCAAWSLALAMQWEG